MQRDVAGFLGGAHAYATTEHVQKAVGTPPVGTRTPGMTMFCPLRRRADLTHEQFVEHWLTAHVPLALEHHPHMVRYVTNVVDQRLSPHRPRVGRLRRDLIRQRRRRRQRACSPRPEGERIVRDDIARFIGHTFPYLVGAYVQKA